ncbi:MAG: hypothetical protein CM1200mP36_02090 [Gammaproteobacteria bacterium]|nr:MAG: hypothetical protein CM1200mP36_02090 [Gammaproteobacteria bacterium]
MSKDYEFIDHSYDVVVVGAGGFWSACGTRSCGAGPNDGVHLQGFPDAEPHSRRPGRHQCSVG